MSNGQEGKPSVATSMRSFRRSNSGKALGYWIKMLLPLLLGAVTVVIGYVQLQGQVAANAVMVSELKVTVDEIRDKLLANEAQRDLLLDKYATDDELREQLDDLKTELVALIRKRTK
jgi:hypothetical protein